MSKRVSPAERLRVQIDEVFAGGQDLARAIEEVAQLGAQLLLQCAVEAEVAAFLGRNRYARVAGIEDARQGMRNGYCPVTVKTTTGPITVQRPKLRGTTERFASQLFGKGVTKTNALEALVIAGFVRGLSTRDVEAALTEALGESATVSRSTVSRICTEIKTEFQEWSARRLDDVSLDYLFVDEQYAERVQSQVAKVAFTGSRRVAEQVAGWAAPRLKALSLELGRPRPARGPARRRPRGRRRGGRGAGLCQLGPGLLRGQPGARAPAPRRATCSSACGARIADLELGPMCTDRGLARHRMLIDDARAHGARVEGGEEVGPGRLAPALVTGAGPGVRLVDEEPFTPIVAVMETPDVPAAIAEANRPDYGLVGYVCGRDLRGALETAQAHPVGDRRDQRLAGGGALRPLRRLARLGRGLRARAPRARGLHPLAAPARAGLAASARCTRRAKTSCSIFGRAPAVPLSPTPPTTRCGSW